MLPSDSDKKKALAMTGWDNALHFLLIPFFWVEECLGRRGAKGKKFKLIFSSVETASGQLVPVPGGCQGSLASSWRHVQAFLAWCCYLHIVIEFTISSFTGISGVGISKLRRLTFPFELKIFWIIPKVSILHFLCEVQFFPVFYVLRVNFGMSFWLNLRFRWGNTH